MKKKIFKGLLPFIAIFVFFSIFDIISYWEVFDNNNFKVPTELTYSWLEKRPPTSNNIEKVLEEVQKIPKEALSDQQKIKTVMNEISNGTYRKKGIISLTGRSVSYPLYFIVPEYGQENRDSPYMYKISEKGEMVFYYNGDYFKGKLPSSSLEIIKNVLNEK